MKKHYLIICAIVLSFIFNINAIAQTFPGKIGVGLGGLGGSSSEYVDVIPTANFGGASTDANGWPTQDFTLSLFDFRPFSAWAPPTDDPQMFVTPAIFGNYQFSWIGQANIANLYTNPGATITGPIYNAISNTSVMTVNWAAGVDPGGWNYSQFVVVFNNTKATSSSATNTGIKNLKITRPGYATNSTQLFTNNFLNAISPFSTMRFMDWLATNNTNVTYPSTRDWTTRQLPNVYPYTKGAPWEHVIALGNLTGKDIWINIPVDATDSYVDQLANLIKTTLRTDVNIYLEYSNEVWNGGFNQYYYNDQAANTGAADLDIRNYVSTTIGIDPGTSKPWANECRVARVAKRIVRIGQIFSTVLGVNINPASRIRPVLAWQAGGYRLEYQHALDYINTTLALPNGKKVYNYIYGVASAPYFGHNPVGGETPLQVISDMTTSSNNNVSGTIEIAQYASQYEVFHLQYEGGPDNGGGSTTNIGNRILANRLPEMQTLITHNYKDNWFSSSATGTAPTSVNGLANYFVMNGGVSRYGCWGASEDLSQLNNITFSGKYMAICSLTGICGSAPTISISSPANNSTVIGSATFSGTTVVTNAPIAKVEFFSGSTLIYTDNSSPFSFVWSPTVPGIYAITAKVIDNAGRYSFAPSFMVSVVAPVLTVNPGILNYTSGGSASSVNVIGNISWTAVSSQTWLTLTGASGIGNGTIAATTSANASTSIRTAQITVSGSTFNLIVNITQTGVAPALTISPSSLNYTPLSSSQNVSITSNVIWTISGNPGWLTLSTVNGFGNKIISFTASSNITTTGRNAAITISGSGINRIVTVSQGGAVLSVNPGSLSYSSALSSQNITLTSNIGWAISGSPGWLALSTASGSGNRVITLTTSLNNTTTGRSASLTISGGSIVIIVSVNQSAAIASISTNPTLLNYPAAGNTQVVTVTSNTNWATTSSQPWVTITGLSGSGNGAVSATALVNSLTGSRTATITISGGVASQIININQNGASAVLTVNPTTLNYSAAGGSQSVSIITNSVWVVSVNGNWLSPSNSSGSNNGSTNIIVSANPGTSARNGIVLVSVPGSTQSVSINQAGAAPILTITPSGLSFTDSDGDTQIINISSNTNWAVSSNQSWLVLSTSSGSGNTAIALNASANSNTNPLTAVVTFTYGANTATVTVTIPGFVPKLNISVSTLNYQAESGIQSVDITSNTNWSVNGIPSWLTATLLSGFGNASVGLIALTNSTVTARNIVLTITSGIMNRLITITQAGASTLAGTGITSCSGAKFLDISQDTLIFIVSQVKVFTTITGNVLWAYEYEANWFEVKVLNTVQNTCDTSKVLQLELLPSVVPNSKNVVTVNGEGITKKLTVKKPAVTTGINKQSSVNQPLTIIPNPASSNGSVIFNKRITIKVLDLIGNEVKSAAGVTELDLTGFKSGIYFITTSDHETRKLIVE